MGKLELRGLPLYAMRLNTSQARNPHLQGQVTQYGHLVNGTGGGMVYETRRPGCMLTMKRT